MDALEIRRRTPMTEQYVTRELKRTGEVGLSDPYNYIAYKRRMFELRFPLLARIAGLFRFGPRAALGITMLALSACTGIPRVEENRACTARGGVEVVILSGEGHMCVKLEELK